MTQKELFEKWKLVSVVTDRLAALFQNDFKLLENEPDFDPQWIKEAIERYPIDVKPLLDKLPALHEASLQILKDWNDRIEAKSLPTEYVGGTFCESIKCAFNEDRKAGDKGFCTTRCKAYVMHEWLDKNGYKIIKERNM